MFSVAGEGIAPKAARRQDTKTGALPDQTGAPKPETEFSSTTLRLKYHSGLSIAWEERRTPQMAGVSILRVLSDLCGRGSEF
jgi:hypothetical protein